MKLVIALLVAYAPFFLGMIRLMREEESDNRNSKNKRVSWNDSVN